MKNYKQLIINTINIIKGSIKWHSKLPYKQRVGGSTPSTPTSTSQEIVRFFYFMMFKCYILYSKVTDKYYVGFTGDEMEERLRKHNSNHKGYTGKTPDWEMVYIEMYNTKTEAYKRE